MSLFQQALNTYSFAEKEYLGKYYADAKEPLAPVGHAITKATIEIAIDQNGNFLSASAVSKEVEKTIFPVTEDSAGRTSKPVAHPLCDQLQYLIPDYEEKHGLYMDQLEEWKDSSFTHPIISAVFEYLKAQTIKKDLMMAELLKFETNGSLKNEKDFVRWIVVGVDGESACWKNLDLQNLFINWYFSKQSELDLDYCMITGNNSVSAKQHAKGVVSLNGNAKLISANDSGGFTYRGRFVTDTEAINVSYDTSQKAHNVLRWVVANQGVYVGNRCFVCWNPQGKKLPKITGLMARRQSETKQTYTSTDYKKSLAKTLYNWKSEFPDDANAVTVAFDAATTGRLSVAYYSEMKAADFIDRLGHWEESCCWVTDRFGVQSPPLDKIADFAFGTLRSSGYETDDGVKKQVMMQLVSSRLEKAPLSGSIKRALVQHAGNLQIVPDDKEHKYLRRDLLFVTCAIIRKFYLDHYKEEWDMALEQEKADRSYQFGRWMAIMEKIEKDTYDGDEKRETNIIRRQQAFITRPYTVAVSVMGHLKTAYYPQLTVSTRNYYEKQIESIIEILSVDEKSLNKPLKDTYLLGYYLQKKEFYTSKRESEEE